MLVFAHHLYEYKKILHTTDAMFDTLF